MKKPSLQEFQKWAKASKPAAMAVLEAKAFAITMRAKVDAYIKPIFDGWKFTYGARLSERDSKMVGQLIPSPKELYLCDDEGGIQAFYAECTVAHKANGYKGPDGNCPALEAEHLQILAENALIELAEPLFGIQNCQLNLKHREDYLKLLIGGCLNAERMAA